MKEQLGARMGRKKIQISRITDERNRQVGLVLVLLIIVLILIPNMLIIMMVLVMIMVAMMIETWTEEVLTDEQK